MKIPPWTYSRLDSIELCPKKYYHSNVKRDFPDPPNEYSIWGDRVHKAIEKNILEETPLPKGMEQWTPIIEKSKALPGEKFVEAKMAIDNQWDEAEWDSAWSRGKGDYLVVKDESAIAIDWKTGRRKPSEQLMLYAGYAFAKFKKLKKVEVAFVWLKEKLLSKDTFLRIDMPKIKAEFAPRVAKFIAAYERDSWPAKPNGLCKKYCAVTTCQFNGRRGR